MFFLLISVVVEQSFVAFYCIYSSRNRRIFAKFWY